VSYLVIAMIAVIVVDGLLIRRSLASCSPSAAR